MEPPSESGDEGRRLFGRTGDASCDGLVGLGNGDDVGRLSGDAGGAGFDHPEMDSPSWCAPYGQMNKAAWPGEALAARILGLKEAWNSEAVFQLIDEYLAATATDGSFLGQRKVEYGRSWHDPRFWNGGGRAGSLQYSISADFFSGMWETCRNKYGSPRP